VLAFFCRCGCSQFKLRPTGAPAYAAVFAVVFPTGSELMTGSKNLIKFTSAKFYFMSASATSQEMLDYFNQLNKAEQKNILQMLKTFLSNRKEGANAQSLEDYTKELEKADAEIEAGDFILHEDVVKYFSKK
jgi:hypothetical protein